jgi:hypothetical protein
MDICALHMPMHYMPHKQKKKEESRPALLQPAHAHMGGGRWRACLLFGV